MPTTLRSMLSMDALSVGRPEVVVAGSGLDRPVRWVHVTEVDDLRDLLAGEEVVLTTGLPVIGPTADPARFARQLAEADSCGLIVELGARIPQVPIELVRAAEEVGLPLVVLHEPVRFVAVTEAVHRDIVGEQYRGLAFAQRTHEVFTDLSLDSADAATILREAADLVGSALVLEDAGRRVVALAAHADAPEVLLDDWEDRSRSAPVLDTPGITGSEPWLTCPVGLRGSAWGRLIAPHSPANPAEAAVVLQRAAQALQLSRLVERDAARLQSQARQSLLQELMDGIVTDESEAVARARALGMAASALYLPVVADFGATAVSDEIVRQRRARAHLETAVDAARDANVQSIAGGLNDGQVALVIGLRSAGAEHTNLLRLANAFTHRQATRKPVVLGVGTAASHLLRCSANLRTTAHTASAGRALPASSLPYLRSTDVRLRGLVAQLQDDERVVRFAESELGELLARESAAKDGMVALLRAYVRLRGNKAALAQESHISRQALYGRLRKLEKILDVSLDDPESVLSIGVALLVHDVRQLRPAQTWPGVPDSRAGGPA